MASQAPRQHEVLVPPKLPSVVPQLPTIMILHQGAITGNRTNPTPQIGLVIPKIETLHRSLQVLWTLWVLKISSASLRPEKSPTLQPRDSTLKL